MKGKTYEEEAFEYWQQEERKRLRLRQQVSRRSVMKGSAIAAMGGVGAWVAGCGGSSNSTGGGSGATAAVTGSAPAGGSPGTSAYSSGYPLVDKYNWRKLDWNAGPPTRGGTAIRSLTIPNNWDPLQGGTTLYYTPFYNQLYFPKLVGANLDGQEFAPDLALSAEPSKDYTSWVFKIPSGVKFHDLAPVNGREMTADDVVYSIKTIQAHGLASTAIDFIQNVTATDSTTVKFDLKRPSFILPNILAMPYYVIFAKEHYEGDRTRWQQQPIGTGAFQLQSSQPPQKFVGVRHPNYWGKDKAGKQLPYLDGFQAQQFQDANSAYAAFKVHNLDSYFFNNNITQFNQAISEIKDAYYTCSPHWATYQDGIILQWNNPKFKDVRVRQALSMAIDRENGIVGKIYQGAGTPSYPIPFDQQGLTRPLGWNDLPASMKYDPKKAKDLLAQAGFPNGFKMSMITATPVQPSFVGVQQYWKDVGVELTFDESDYLVYLSKLLKKDFPDAALYSGVAGFDIESVVRPLYLPGSPQNWGNVDDPQLTSLMDKLQTSVVANERASIAKQINDRCLDQVTQIYVAGYHAFGSAHSYLHTMAQSLYTTIENWGGINWREVWLEESTPGGRGGKKA